MNINEIINALIDEECILSEQKQQIDDRLQEIEITKRELTKFKKLKVICGECGGTGKVFRRSCAEDDGDYFPCDNCKGIGRLNV